MFRNEKFPGFQHPYNLLEFFQNIGIDSYGSKSSNGSMKNNRFSAEEAKNYIPRTEKRKKGTSMSNA